MEEPLDLTLTTLDLFTTSSYYSVTCLLQYLMMHSLPTTKPDDVPQAGIDSSSLLLSSSLSLLCVNGEIRKIN